MLQNATLVSINLRNGRAEHCLFQHTTTRIPWIKHWEEIPHPSEGPRGRLAQQCRGYRLCSEQISRAELSCTSWVLSKKKYPHFRPVPVQLQSNPSCHQITTHLGKIQTRRKAEIGDTGVRRGWSSTPCLCSWANGICDVLLLLCQSNVKFYIAREGK